MANVKWIDATIWVDGDDKFTGVGDENEWRDKFNGLFERYAYGREVAPETKRRHLQFRGVLKVACDAACLNYLSSLGFRNIQPTHVRDFEYVYKDKDFFCSWDVYRPEYDLVRTSPHVWQIQLDELDRDDRTIEVVWDERGNSGKTAWAMYQDYLHKAVYIPPLKRGLDLVACVLGKRESDWYIIDTPRAFEFTDDWACSIEQLKNGYVFDTRYSFRDRYLSVRPRVTILCNHLPDYDNYFSADRVLPFKITPDGYLWSV